jgi:flagellar L-ring protein FlgH
MRLRKRVPVLVAVLFALQGLAGCGAIARLHTDENAKSNPEVTPREVSYSAKEVPSSGSLFREAGFRGFYKDLRAREVGDLVTINISESAKANKKAETKTSRESSISAGINNALGWETKIKELTSLGVKKPRSALDNNNLFKGSLSSEFTGTGETNRDDTMTASITARVTSVTPEGNLYIMGTREIRVNNETQFITLTGLIRPEDISPDNTVLSSYVADARIAYSGNGSVSDKQRPGWLMRLADFIWPY